MALVARDRRSLTHYQNVEIDQSVSYKTLLTLAEGWLGRVKDFQQKFQLCIFSGVLISAKSNQSFMRKTLFS